MYNHALVLKCVKIHCALLDLNNSYLCAVKRGNIWIAFICSLLIWFSIQMPSTIVPSIWTAYLYSNGGLNTGLLTAWWYEYQTTMASSIWIANHTTSEQIPMIWTSSLLRSLLYTEIKKNCVYRWTIKEKDYMDVENAMLNNFNKFLSNKRNLRLE